MRMWFREKFKTPKQESSNKGSTVAPFDASAQSCQAAPAATRVTTWEDEHRSRNVYPKEA